MLTMSMQVSGESSGNGILSSAAASIQLLPHLLGFPVRLTALSEVLPSPGPLPGPEGAPREAMLSYKGAMLDGLQASRKLNNARPPGQAAPVQSRKTYQSSSGRCLSVKVVKQQAVKICCCHTPNLMQLKFWQVAWS